ncbi:3-oxoadipate enol-lactonase [Actinomadura sp. 21ATH]|uniref:3-oxoadipate enol-lactonase n=1 Tax=Actinomadura sp. 21ATH TaxID=1735444 RepID=UPI0035C04A96
MILHHRLDGPEDAPVLVLGPSLGTSTELWAPQMAVLAGRYRVLRYDLPGHGEAPPPERGFTVEDLAGALVDVLDARGVGRAAYAGVSLGGAIGQAFALRAPERLASLVLVCTSPRFGGPEGWRERAALVRREGTAPLAATAPGRWFTPGFGGSGPYTDMLRATDPDGYAACCDALALFDATARLPEIAAPTLVIAGADDPATPVEGHADRLAAGIPGARLTVLDGASHLAGAERPAAVTEAITTHLDRTWKDPAG